MYFKTIRTHRKGKWITFYSYSKRLLHQTRVHTSRYLFFRRRMRLKKQILFPQHLFETKGNLSMLKLLAIFFFQTKYSEKSRTNQIITNDADKLENYI